MIFNTTHKEALELEKLLSKKEESFWHKRGEKAYEQQFTVVKDVPAYREFLKEHNIAIDTISDIRNLPAPSKENYLRKFPFETLFTGDTLTSEPRVFSVTSGSTGKPFYFPRVEAQDKQYQLLAEIYLRTNYKIHERKTLYIDAFPMGPWIGGVFTYEVVTRIAREGKYPLSVITTGIDTPTILRTIEELGDYYDQIIIGAYGPFLKDALDKGVSLGIDFKKYNIKFVFSAEAFPESFRDYVCNLVGCENPLLDTLNHYGTVDLGTMSYETPISILIRRIANDNPELYKDIFGDIIKIPTLTQYLPELFYFESIENNLYCTSNSAIPLFRYDLQDRGDVISFEDMVALFKKHGVDLYQEAEKAGIEDTLWKIPFVYVFERSDFSVSYYAFQVYPGPIRHVLLEDDLHEYVTSKFTLESTFSESQDPQLVVHVECKAEVEQTDELKKKVFEKVHKALMETHSEYKETIGHIGERAYVVIKLWPQGDQTHFKVGGKQKWIHK